MPADIKIDPITCLLFSIAMSIKKFSRRVNFLQVVRA